MELAHRASTADTSEKRGNGGNVSEPNDSIERLIKESMPESIVTHYIAIVEVMEEEGQRLRLVLSESMTPWMAIGMLEGGTRMIDAYGHEDFSPFDEYEEDEEDD